MSFNDKIMKNEFQIAKTKLKKISVDYPIIVINSCINPCRIPTSKFITRLCNCDTLCKSHKPVTIKIKILVLSLFKLNAALINGIQLIWYSKQLYNGSIAEKNQNPLFHVEEI